MVCYHCGSSEIKSKWDIQVASYGDEAQDGSLCTICDIKLNDFILKFFRIRGRAALIKTYKIYMEKK